jgi:hypothetical protein
MLMMYFIRSNEWCKITQKLLDSCLFTENNKSRTFLKGTAF